MNEDKLLAVHRMAQHSYRLARELTHGADGDDPAVQRLCQLFDVAQSQAGDLVEQRISGQARAQNKPRAVRRDLRNH